MFKRIFYVCIASTFLSSFCYANKANIFESSYTSIAAKDCTLQDSNPVLEYASQNCKGFAEIDVEVIEDRSRQTLKLSQGSQEYPLNLLSLGFSKLGATIEWRHKKGQPDDIVGMIVRLNVSEQGSNTGKKTSYLIVSKVTANKICVVAKIPPLSNSQQNKQARLIAEKSVQMPCLDADNTKDKVNTTKKSSKKTAAEIPVEYPVQSDYYEQHITDARMTDSDGDGINNYDDICPSVADPKQEDGDADQVGDACDACPKEAAQRYSNGCASSTTEKNAIDTDNSDSEKSPKPEGLLKSLLKWQSSTL